MRKGRFIVIEGIDGSGKGTQSKLLYEWLSQEGYDVFLTSEPTDGKIGGIIREGLKKGSLDPITEALLFAADRKEHTSLIEFMLKSGRIVVCDRYLYSSLAYQGARGLSLEWIRKINSSALKPDILIILDIEPELALERVNSRSRKTEYFERLDFLKKVRDAYLDLEEGLVIDASKTHEEVHEEIRLVVSTGLKSASLEQG